MKPIHGRGDSLQDNAAFTTAKLAVNGMGFPWAPLLAVALTVVVGILVGSESDRARMQAAPEALVRQVIESACA